MKKRTILTSLMSVAMLATIASGATYALFTAEDQTSIAVTAGKVAVDAEIENLSIFSMDKELTDAFENGGTAVYENSVLTLDRMTPGDKVEFDIRVTNSSNIDIQYRLNWSVEGKLAEVLNITANDNALENLAWTEWKATSNVKEIVINVVVDLPVSVGDEYQEQKCDISFSVEAVQGNALSIKYATPSTIDHILANAKAGDEIELAAGYYDEIVIPQNGMKIFSEEAAEVGFLNVNSRDDVTLQGLTFDAAGAKIATDGRGNAKQYASVVGANGSANNNGARNLVIDDCDFVGTFASDGVAIAFVDQNRGSGQSGNITITNCEFSQGNAGYNIYAHYSGFGTFVIENNTFDSKCIGNPVYLGRYQSSTPVVVKGNTFKYADTLENSVYVQAHSSAYNPSIDAANNTFGSLILLATPSSIAYTLSKAQAGSVVELAEGYYGEIVVPQNGMKIYSVEDAVVGFLNVNGKDNVTLQGLTFDAAGAKIATDGRGTAKQPVNIAAASGKSNGKGARNLVVDDCNFVGTFANGGGAIAFVDQGRGSGQSGDVTIKNCEFAQEGAYFAIYTYYSGYGYFVIENNTFNMAAAIYLGRYQSSTPVVVKGNTFNADASFEDAAYIQDHSNYGVSFKAENNKFLG